MESLFGGQAPGAESAIDKALLRESLGLGALPTLPTATQGGVALRSGNVQQLGDDGQRPVGVGASGKALLPAVRTLPSAAMAVQAISPGITPTRGIQGQKVTPAARTLQ